MFFPELSAINWLSIFSLLSIVVHALGVFSAAHAVMKVRSSRSAIAWSIALITFPWVTLPLYWVLGKSKFSGYTDTLQKAYLEHRGLVEDAYSSIMSFRVDLQAGEYKAFGQLASTFESFPFTSNNQLRLLVDGEQTFRAMLSAIATAQDYILLQSYIIHSDDIGNQFKDALIVKAKQGVRIYFLYDGLGSRTLSKDYIQTLKDGGIAVAQFRSSRGRTRFQINFRNHRKILIVDGKIAFMGGLNIGDEYLGKDPKFGNWRDTHAEFHGTAVKCLQGILLRDWYWATQDFPDVSWDIEKCSHYDQTAFILSTGPADRLEECTLFFLHLIDQATERFWFASPYFVPDDSILRALQLAALRGVDVRIILPNKPDHLSVYFCAFSFYAELQQVGIQLYRYQSGFMHQKVVLVDDAIAGVGTINLDNRSFYLNFEVMSFVINDATQHRTKQYRTKHKSATGDRQDESKFIQAVEKMLEKDLENSRLVDFSKYDQKPFWFKLAARASRLMAPIL